jgi:hypothetical protein
MCATALRPSADRLYPPSSVETMRPPAYWSATFFSSRVIQM